jgi:hypothetical protein
VTLPVTGNPSGPMVTVILIRTPTISMSTSRKLLPGVAMAANDDEVVDDADSALQTSVRYISKGHVQKSVGDLPVEIVTRVMGMHPCKNWLATELAKTACTAVPCMQNFAVPSGKAGLVQITVLTELSPNVVWILPAGTVLLNLSSE